jgi:large subunit ribosomal protein L17
MRHRVKKVILNKPRGQRRLLLKNLATSLVLHEKIKTTEAKAKALQPYFEKLVIAAKKPNRILAIRNVNSILQSELGSKKMVEVISKKYENRQSGFTKITKLGFRSGDTAPLVQIELV